MKTAKGKLVATLLIGATLLFRATSTDAETRPAKEVQPDDQHVDEMDVTLSPKPYRSKTEAIIGLQLSLRAG